MATFDAFELAAQTGNLLGGATCVQNRERLEVSFGRPRRLVRGGLIEAIVVVDA